MVTIAPRLGSTVTRISRARDDRLIVHSSRPPGSRREACHSVVVAMSKG
jgi:hypothetical protein